MIDHRPRPFAHFFHEHQDTAPPESPALKAPVLFEATPALLLTLDMRKGKGSLQERPFNLCAECLCAECECV
jgi:hypothetical protein